MPSLEQVQRSPAGAGVPLEWVLGGSLDSLRLEADISVVGGKIILVPVGSWGSRWEKIEIGFAGNARFPTRYIIHDTAGEVVEFELFKLVRNGGVSESRFVPRWPEGVDIVTLGE